MKKWLWVTTIVALLLTIPSIFQRSSAEWNNRTYETIIPYEHIEDMVELSKELDESFVLDELKRAGLRSVSLEPDTLRNMERKGELLLIDPKRIKEFLFHSGEDPWDERLPQEKGVYVYPKDDSVFIDRVLPFFDTAEPIPYERKRLYFIPDAERSNVDKPISYDPEVIAAIKEHGLKIVPRIPNTVSEDERQVIMEQLVEMKDESTEKVLFAGDSVPGFPERNEVLGWGEFLKNAGYTPFVIEMSDQKGFSSIANIVNFDVIRLHSIDPTKLDEQVSVDRIVRAVKERNIKAIFIRIPSRPTVEESFDETVSLLQAIDREMPGLFVAGDSQPFKQIPLPIWQKLVILIGGVAFIGLAALEVTKRRWAAYAVMAGMALVALAYLAAGAGLFVKGFALAVAVAGPVYAVIPKKDLAKTGRGELLKQYGIAAFISLVAVWIVVVLLNGNQFLVGVDQFRGVKLLYILPIGFIVLYAIWKNIIPFLRLAVRYWHMAGFAIIGAVAFYYLSRTGNEGSVSSFELTARQALEHLMYIRPRTKEFLFGFPFYVLALYLGREHKRLSLFLLIPGVIGFLSLVNTFTHLHIPLYVSLLRSVYGLAIGLLIGLLFIQIYKIGNRFIARAREKWEKGASPPVR